jgi:hypothetical protein
MKKTNRNSADALKTLAADSLSNEVEIPAGIELNADERALWPQFASARMRGDWREFDLLLLAKIVQLEVEIRATRAGIKAQGATIENRRGTPIDNPLYRVLDLLQRQQLALIRCLSLTKNGDPRTMGSRKFRGDKFKDALAFDDDGLFARPQ